MRLFIMDDINRHNRIKFAFMKQLKIFENGKIHRFNSVEEMEAAMDKS